MREPRPVLRAHSTRTRLAIPLARVCAARAGWRSAAHAAERAWERGRGLRRRDGIGSHSDERRNQTARVRPRHGRTGPGGRAGGCVGAGSACRRSGSRVPGADRASRRRQRLSAPPAAPPPHRFTPAPLRLPRPCRCSPRLPPRSDLRAPPGLSRRRSFPLAASPDPDRRRAVPAVSCRPRAPSACGVCDLALQPLHSFAVPHRPCRPLPRLPAMSAWPALLGRERCPG